MARILVAGDTTHAAARQLLERLCARVRSDGHDGSTPGQDLSQEAHDADGAILILDGCDAASGALLAAMHGLGKPVLGLASTQPPATLAGLCDVHLAPDPDAWPDALARFYDAVRPFAGRVVRDRIPELVREAGHHVAFREVGAEERPRFLKQKVAAEAKELLGADVGKEKEEVADVLEALESFIVARGFDRDDLKRIKEAKRKRRGGFAKVYVVESTAEPPADP